MKARPQPQHIAGTMSWQRFAGALGSILLYSQAQDFTEDLARANRSGTSRIAPKSQGQETSREAYIVFNQAAKRP